MLRQHTKGPEPKPAEERFWLHVDKHGPIPSHMPHLGNCWVWTGAQNGRGYGSFRLSYPKRIQVLAHRFAYGDCSLNVLHHCDNRACVRRDHLWEGTNADNMHDMIAKGRDRKHTGPHRAKR